MLNTQEAQAIFFCKIASGGFGDHKDLSKT
jgi:hypothetical protein